MGRGGKESSSLLPYVAWQARQEFLMGCWVANVSLSPLPPQDTHNLKSHPLVHQLNKAIENKKRGGQKARVRGIGQVPLELSLACSWAMSQSSRVCFPSIRDWSWGQDSSFVLGRLSLSVFTLDSVLQISILSFCLLLCVSHPRGHRWSEYGGIQETQLKGQSLQKFINQVLSEHRHTHSLTHCLVAFMLQQQNLSGCKRTVWPVQSTIFTIWPFTERTCPSFQNQRSHTCI